VDHPWLDFWNKFAETLGVAAGMTFLGSAFLLFVTPEQHSFRRGFTVIVGGQLLNAVATAFVHGYLGWSFYAAPAIGLACGLIGSFILLAVIKVGQERAIEIVSAGVNKVTGQETKP
jgi:hypothetical protein